MKMSGVLDRTVGTSEKTLNNVLNVIRSERGLTLNERRLAFRLQSGVEPTKRHRKAARHQLFEAARRLKECAILEDVFGFNLVELDSKAMIRANHKIPIPLIWTVTLPIKSAKVTQTISHDGRDYKVTTLVPPPPDKAVDLYKEHKDKFDRMELWWVPNQVSVQAVPEPKPIVRPDPMLVGVKVIPGLANRYFNLFRWIDETYESGWWAREAY